MKTKRRLLWKTLINGVLIALGTVLLILFLRQMQNTTSEYQQYDESVQLLNRVVDTLNQNQQDAASLTEFYHNCNQETLENLSSLLTSGLFSDLADDSLEERCTRFQELISRSGVEYLLVINSKGNVLLYPSQESIGQNLIELQYMTEENLAAFTSGSKKPVKIENSMGSFYFYSTPVENGGETVYLILGENSSILDVQYSSLTDITNLLGGVTFGNSGFVFAVDNATGNFLYYSKDGTTLTGQNALENGLTRSLLTDGASGTATINGNEYYCVSKAWGSTTIVTAALSSSELYSNNTRVIFWAALVFLMVALLSLAYTFIIRNDLIRNKKEQRLIHILGTKLTYNATVGQKVLPLTAAGLLLIFGVSYYAQTLLSLSRAITLSGNVLQQVSSDLNSNEAVRHTIEEYYGDRYVAKAQLLAYLLEEDPSVLNESTEFVHFAYDSNGTKYFLTDDEDNSLRSVGNSATLQELCDRNDLSAIYIFDEQGRTIATNTSNWYFTLGLDKASDSYAFRQVLDGKLESLVQTQTGEDEETPSKYAGATFRYYTTTDENGQTRYVSRYNYESYLAGTWEGNPITKHRSLLQVVLNSDLVIQLLHSTDLSYVLSQTAISENGFVVAFTQDEPYALLYSPQTENIGKTAEELGISTDFFSGAAHSYGTVNGESYFECFQSTNEYWLGVCFPVASLHEARLPISLITTLVGFLVITLMQTLFLFSTEEEEKLYEALESERPADGTVTVTMPTGEKQTTVSALARLIRQRNKWNDKSPEQKLLTLVRGCLGIMVLLLLIAMVNSNTFFGDSAVITYILSGSWQKGFNIFALTSCIVQMMGIIVISSLINSVIRLITSIFGVKTATIGHLLRSVVSYGSAMGGIFYCLYLLGLQPASLLTSAGILSVVIGLGAQSLIGDVLAGIFIVFEGEFRVGDIVTIGEFRGTVIEIGIRTTKIADIYQNIKVFNNSQITGVVNMTKETSFVRCTLCVSYEESVERVETVLAREFPGIKKKLPAILEGPFYMGVSDLGDNAVSLLISAKCNEEDCPQLERDLNRQLLIACNRHHINIPYPQVTVSYLDEEAKKQAASKTVQQVAENFVKQQKEATKSMAEMENDHRET